MRRWAFLLRPGWLALALVVAAFAYLCFTVLAPWQLGKNTTTTRQNDKIAHSLTMEPVALTSLLGQDSSEIEWRRVTATGRYLPEAQVLARLRVVEGKQAYEVLTPFAVDDGPTVLVNRGYVRPVQGSEVPAVPPPPDGAVTITARLRNSEPLAEGRKPIHEDGVPQVYSINTAQVAELGGNQLIEPYLQLVDDQPGGLGVIALPHLDAGPFLSYGIQWIAFGILAPIGLGYFVYAEIRQRRRERAAEQAAATSTTATPATPEEKLADRYGRRR